MNKLYIIVRNDLSPGSQIAQACHSIIGFQLKFPNIIKTWEYESNTIVILQIENLEKLMNLLNSAHYENIKCFGFYEPDMNDELTAIVLEPTEKSKYLCANLKLALKENNMLQLLK